MWATFEKRAGTRRCGTGRKQEAFKLRKQQAWNPSSGSRSDWARAGTRPCGTGRAYTEIRIKLKAGEDNDRRAKTTSSESNKYGRVGPRPCGTRRAKTASSESNKHGTLVRLLVAISTQAAATFSSSSESCKYGGEIGRCRCTAILTGSAGRTDGTIRLLLPCYCYHRRHH